MTTTMTTLQRAEEARKLWAAVFPQCPAPTPRQFYLWALRFSDSLIERAVLKSSRKFTSRIPDPTVVHRYVTGLLLNLEREITGTTMNQNTTDSGQNFYRNVAAEAIRRRGPNISFADLPAILAEYQSATGAPSDSQEAGTDAL